MPSPKVWRFLSPAVPRSLWIALAAKRPPLAGMASPCGETGLSALDAAPKERPGINRPHSMIVSNYCYQGQMVKADSAKQVVSRHPRCLGHPGSHNRIMDADAPRPPHSVHLMPIKANSTSASSPCFRMSCLAGSGPRWPQVVQMASLIHPYGVSLMLVSRGCRLGSLPPMGGT